MGFVLTMLKYLGDQNPKRGTHDKVLQLDFLYLESGLGLKSKFKVSTSLFQGFVRNNVLV